MFSLCCPASRPALKKTTSKGGRGGLDGPIDMMHSRSCYSCCLTSNLHAAAPRRHDSGGGRAPAMALQRPWKQEFMVSRPEAEPTTELGIEPVGRWKKRPAGRPGRGGGGIGRSMLRCENVTRERGARGRCGAEEDDESTTAATAATTYTRPPGRAGAKLVAGFELKKED